MGNFDALSDEQVADEITTWAGRVAAGEARLLALIGEFDRREAWGGIGLLSCAHWLSWRLGMGLKAAHERVRVARALTLLPLTADAFTAGRLSWTQVRAITRVAVADDEAGYVEIAQHATGAQLERLVRGVRRARKPDEDAADPEAAAYRMRTRVRYEEDGTMVITSRLPAEQGAIVLAALEAARAQIDHEARQAALELEAESSAEDSCPRAPASSEKSDRPGTATMAEAMLRVAEDALAVQRHTRPGATRRGRARLTALVDPLSGWGRLADGELLPPCSLASVLRTLPAQLRLRPAEAADRTTEDLGRLQHEPSLRLRELLGTIDGERCRFPGCTRRRKLHGHHVIFWSAGGPTDLANLVLLCGRHHTIVHREGFQLILKPDRMLTVRTSSGLPIPHLTALPWQRAEDLDPGRHVHADTLPPTTHGDRLDLGYVVSVLLQQAA